MKKLLSLAVAAAMVLSCTAMAFAAETAEPSESPTGGAGFPFKKVTIVDGGILSDEEYQAIMQERLMAMSEEPAMLTTLTQSATGKDDGYVFEKVTIVSEDDIMAMGSVSEYELAPGELKIFSNALLDRRIRLSVSYRPTTVTLYYGVATTTDPKTAWYYSNDATGGYGTVVFEPQQPGSYYPYIGNTSDKVMYVDFSYTPF